MCDELNGLTSLNEIASSVFTCFAISSADIVSVFGTNKSLCGFWVANEIQNPPLNKDPFLGNLKNRITPQRDDLFFLLPEHVVVEIFRESQVTQNSIPTMAETDLGLRQRKGSSPEKKEEAAAIEKKGKLGNLSIYFEKLGPYINKASDLVAIAIPYVHKAVDDGKKIWVKLSPYKPELLAPAFAGLIMCFFGGSFVTLIAAVEAYRMCGYETTLKCCKDLYEEFEKVIVANAEDNKKDEDGDGVADVNQISAQQLATRKTLLFLKTVDPKLITIAISGVTSGFLAVTATLKLQFAKAITLGNAIGDGERIADSPSYLLMFNPWKDRIPASLIELCIPLFCSVSSHQTSEAICDPSTRSCHSR